MFQLKAIGLSWVLHSVIGNLTAHHQELFYRNPVFSGVSLPECSVQVPLQDRCPTITPTALDLAKVLLPGRSEATDTLSSVGLQRKGRKGNMFSREIKTVNM